MSMTIRLLSVVCALLMATAITSTGAVAAGKEHNLVIHVDENDKQKMTIALNMVEQTIKLWEARGDTVKFEIVAHGPGLHMLRADTSPVRKRIGLMSTQIEGLRFSACANTMRRVKAKEDKEVKLLPEAELACPH